MSGSENRFGFEREGSLAEGSGFPSFDPFSGRPGFSPATGSPSVSLRDRLEKNVNLLPSHVRAFLHTALINEVEPSYGFLDCVYPNAPTRQDLIDLLGSSSSASGIEERPASAAGATEPLPFFTAGGVRQDPENSALQSYFKDIPSDYQQMMRTALNSFQQRLKESEGRDEVSWSLITQLLEILRKVSITGGLTPTF